MAQNIFKSISNFFNKVVDVLSQGNFERVRVVNEFNQVFREAYLTGEMDRHCSVKTSSGVPEFHHNASYHYLRSGFKITIENDNNLSVEDFIEISKYVLENTYFVRQLMWMGYDTLIIQGRSNMRGIPIPLKDFAELTGHQLRR